MTICINVDDLATVIDCDRIAAIAVACPFPVVVDERVPVGRFLVAEPVIAERHGRVYRTLPPSAVVALREMRNQ